jgi:hypothetical protein
MAWASGLPKIGTYYDLELDRDGNYSTRFFEVYDLKLSKSLEEKVIRESIETVIPSTHPKFGFTQMKGRPLPKKVYLGSVEQVRSGSIAGAHSIGSNALAYIEADLEAHNQVVRTVLSRLKPGTMIKVEAATLVRIRISTGEFLLLPNKGTWNKGRGDIPKGSIVPSAVGGVAEADVARLLTLSGQVPDFEKASNLKLKREVWNGRTDINLEFRADYWSRFVSWFESTPDREHDPTRELYEELVHENRIFNDDDWQELGLSGSCSSLASKKP